LPEKIFFWLVVAVLWAMSTYVIELSTTDPALLFLLRRLQYMGGCSLRR
jgi:hypothetical protein